MPHFFLSYRRSDREGQTLTHMVFRELRRRYGESSVFLDVHSRSPGLSFRAKVDQALNVTDVVLVFIGPEWLQRLNEKLDDSQDWVRYEVAESLKREGLPVVPVCCLGVKFPQQSELPDDLKELVWRDGVTVDPHQDFESHLARLLSDLERVLAASNEKKQLAKKPAEAERATPKAAAQPTPSAPAAKPPALSGSTTKAPAAKYYSVTPTYTAWTVALSLVEGGAWSFLLAVLYSRLLLALPFVQLNFVLTALYGCFCGAIVGHAVHRHRIWSDGAAAFAGLATGLLAIYFAWVTWIDMRLVPRNGILNFLSLLITPVKLWQSFWAGLASFLNLAVSPARLWQSICAVNSTGAWDIWGFKPTGGWLWLVWTLEALLIVGLSTYFSFEMINGESRIFCTNCRSRCAWTIGAAKLRSSSADEIKRRFEARDWAFFRSLGAPPRGAERELLVNLCRCQKCGGTNALYAKLTGKAPKWAVLGLLITPTECDVISRIGKDVGGTA